jgi:hypothetical protein
MTNFQKRLLIIAIGLLGGACAWPLVELAIARQNAFPSYFLFTALVGGIVGVVLGAFFASAEGICDSSLKKALDGAWKGAIAGAAGGFASALVAQAFLFYVGERIFQAAGGRLDGGLVIARSLGWLVVGASIGLGEGIRAGSGKKMALGIAGGSLGGFAGGLAFTLLSLYVPGFYLGRLVALLFLGGLIGLLYSLLERRFAVGSLKALNGPLKGKEFLINQRALVLGAGPECDIRLQGYREVAERHAALRAKRGELRLKRADGRVLLNDKEAMEEKLRLDDVIQIGSAKFLYGYFG